MTDKANVIGTVHGHDILLADDKRFQVHGKLIENSRYDTYAAAEEAINRRVKAAAHAQTRKLDLKVMAVRKPSRWDKDQEPRFVTGTVKGLHRKEGTLLFTDSKAEITESTDVFPNVEWLRAPIMERHELLQKIRKLDAVIDKFKIASSYRHRIYDEEDHVRQLDKLEQEHADKLALAQKEDPAKQAAA